ncbi:MAG: T9SS type A sorting domain-containing protein [Bacteroidetes bacterium]|nr:T9SS type A sorting domain-containing protein [Bacteroidota bacterium]
MKRIFLSQFVFFVMISLTCAQTPYYVPANGLQAWYSFSGNINDGSGNGNNGINYSAVLTPDRHGTANSAYNFNGTTSYILVSTPSFTFDAAGSFTYSLWMKKVAGTGPALMVGNSVADNFISLMGGGLSNFAFGTNKQALAWVWATCAHTLNVWDHYVGTYNAGVMNLYKNGVFQSTATYTYTGANAVNLPLYIGKDVTTEYFTGSLDDIGIWNRVLTSAEIQDLYNSCDLSVTTQPLNQTINLTDNATFNVATNYGVSTFQWQKAAGTVFQNLSNSTHYSGTNSAILHVINATFADNNSQFRCVVSSGVCLDTSDVAILTVNNNVGLPDYSEKTTFSVYPNPAGEYIIFQMEAENSDYAIIDPIGKTLQKGKLNERSVKIDINDLTPGAYLIQINGRTDLSFKFVKK